MYKLFLDDERFPVDNDWVIVRSYDEFAHVIQNKGIPLFISFDHDLGIGKTGLNCASFLANYVIDHDVLYNDMSFYVHSQNPVGAENIQAYMTSFIKIWKMMSTKGKNGDDLS